MYVLRTMASMITRYHLSEFNDIIYEGFSYELSQEVLTMIQSLADKVGAPEYVKTPQFSKREKPGYPNKRKHKNQEIADEDWEAIRVFQTTQLKKKEGLDASLDTIRKYLNKITDKTYDSLSNSIFEELSVILEVNEPTEDILLELNKIGEAIFNIASSNLFYSELYARLYNDLMNKYPLMESLFKDNFIKFGDVFKTIEYCSPDVDYDKFCEINKTNEKRRALSAFYVNLMKLNVVEYSSIIEIIQNLQSYMMKLINTENNKPIVDELSEVLYILVTKSANFINEEVEAEEWENILDNIRVISLMKVSDRPSLTNKSIFKHMDILDEFN
tara:strand:+ start:61 stop:1050 length:990 start_codon:yes stop_codon:yes gene_type:complete